MKKKIMYIAILGILLFLIYSLTASFATAADGDVYYFTDTDVSWDDTQFSIILNLALFVFFFWVGYFSPKRSGGGFMIVSAIMLFSLEALLVPVLSAVFVIPLISPVAIFILFLGIRKQFYPMEGDETKSEAS